jgi:hypothetical protein
VRVNARTTHSRRSQGHRQTKGEESATKSFFAQVAHVPCVVPVHIIYVALARGAV